ncbi:MAG TPA: hypothetical protein VLH56_08645 [Dissulfurispiraceae bacterium]|nr:hypothetical protein [Dissulfurispiraceae bacterium]
MIRWLEYECEREGRPYVVSVAMMIPDDPCKVTAIYGYAEQTGGEPCLVYKEGKCFRFRTMQEAQSFLELN